ncbi:MAG: hypothetical protein ACKKL5_00240 [Candidatus Komeilibacteria bacterium]
MSVGAVTAVEQGAIKDFVQAHSSLDNITPEALQTKLLCLIEKGAFREYAHYSEKEILEAIKRVWPK